MEQRLSLVTLAVRDLSRSRAFYEGLGWQPSPKSVEGEVVFFQAGGIIMGLYGRENQARDARLDPQEIGWGIVLAYNTRSRSEVDGVLMQAEACGGKLLKAAEETTWGGYVGYFADPDGHTWEIAWNRAFELTPEGAIHLEPAHAD